MQFIKWNENMDRLEEGKRVFDIEIEALEKTKTILDETYLKILECITNCKGKVIITGMGKSGHIAAKMASTFASLGTPAVHLHPAEAMHGDLGMVTASDVLIAISFSGESDEVIRLIPSLKMIGTRIIAITGNRNSTLAKSSDIVQVLPELKEACHLGLAPTSSTTAVLCYGDSLAVVASMVYGFDNSDFGIYHPAGALGKGLTLKVKDVMTRGNDNAIIDINCLVKDAIVEMSIKGLGAVTVVCEDRIVGIITDGDIRRQLEKEVDIYSLKVDEIMTRKPVTISADRLAVEALNVMKSKKVSCLVVCNHENVIGMLSMRDLSGIGLIANR